MAVKPKAKAGRKPSGTPDATPSVREKAFDIYKASSGKAGAAKIATELSAGGHKYTEQIIRKWKRDGKWDDRLAKGIADASEDVRHRLSVVRVPEDLALVEQASEKLYAVSVAAADHLLRQIEGIKVTSAAEFEQYARACTSIMTTHFEVAKGMEELARRRIGAFSDGPAEITPPSKGRSSETKDEVISRFTEARQAH